MNRAKNEIKINDMSRQNLSRAKKNKNDLGICGITGYSLETEKLAAFKIRIRLGRREKITCTIQEYI